MKAVLLDTGAIVAALDRSEKQHDRCVEAIGEIRLPLVTCEAVITESCYLLRRVRGAPEAILANVAASIFQIPLPLANYAELLVPLLRKYADHQIDLADACLIHLATELGVAEILTLDRDFTHYRWKANRPFQLLIPLQ